MGSLIRAAVAAVIVFIGMSLQTTDAGVGGGISLQATWSCDVTVCTEIRHPASRKTVAGPWPRFAKEMLA